jgi:hypothetical protein
LDYKVDLKPRYSEEQPHQALLEIISENDSMYEKLLKNTLNYKDTLLSINKKEYETDDSQPTYNNEFLPGLDIITLYSNIAYFKPENYIEVGSGNSTKVAFKAKKETNPNMKITSIDPFPRSEIDALSDKVVRRGFEDVDYSDILNLKENDILFIDNSHRILPNSDAMVFFLEILPKLNKGVVVHIHDIYLPYDYPQFMCDRFYSEQYGLAMYLLANHSKYNTILPNYYVYKNPKLHSLLNDFWNSEKFQGIETHGGSYWLQIK